MDGEYPVVSPAVAYKVANLSDAPWALFDALQEALITLNPTEK